MALAGLALLTGHTRRGRAYVATSQSTRLISKEVKNMQSHKNKIESKLITFLQNNEKKHNCMSTLKDFQFIKSLVNNDISIILFYEFTFDLDYDSIIDNNNNSKIFFLARVPKT